MDIAKWRIRFFDRLNDANIAAKRCEIAARASDHETLLCYAVAQRVLLGLATAVGSADSAYLLEQSPAWGEYVKLHKYACIELTEGKFIQNCLETRPKPGEVFGLICLYRPVARHKEARRESAEILRRMLMLIIEKRNLWRKDAAKRLKLARALRGQLLMYAAILTPIVTELPPRNLPWAADREIATRVENVIANALFKHAENKDKCAVIEHVIVAGMRALGMRGRSANSLFEWENRRLKRKREQKEIPTTSEVSEKPPTD